jgi:hypothetical protein
MGDEIHQIILLTTGISPLSSWKLGRWVGIYIYLFTPKKAVPTIGLFIGQPKPTG